MPTDLPQSGELQQTWLQQRGPVQTLNTVHRQLISATPLSFNCTAVRLSKSLITATTLGSNKLSQHQTVVQATITLTTLIWAITCMFSAVYDKTCQTSYQRSYHHCIMLITTAFTKSCLENWQLMKYEVEIFFKCTFRSHENNRRRQQQCLLITERSWHWQL